MDGHGHLPRAYLPSTRMGLPRGNANAAVAQAELSVLADRLLKDDKNVPLWYVRTQRRGRTRGGPPTPGSGRVGGRTRVGEGAGVLIVARRPVFAHSAAWDVTFDVHTRALQPVGPPTATPLHSERAC